MTQIEKIKAEIERLKASNNCGTDEFIEAKRIAYEQVLSFIESLEQEPEGELEKEIITYQRENMDRDTTVGNVARHFYELGRKSQAALPTIKGWVARDDDNTLCVFSMKPERVFSDALSRHYWHPTLGRIPIKRWFFFGLKPEDEPIEVELVIRKV